MVVILALGISQYHGDGVAGWQGDPMIPLNYMRHARFKEIK